MVSTNKAIYQVHQFGEKYPSYICKEEFGFRAEGLLICEGYGVHGNTFKYNTKTGNFLSSATLGYVHSKEGKVSLDTPSMDIGKCSKM